MVKWDPFGSFERALDGHRGHARRLPGHHLTPAPLGGETYRRRSVAQCEEAIGGSRRTAALEVPEDEISRRRARAIRRIDP